MSWARIDDGFFRHPKARAAGKDGRALFMAGLCWSAGHLTDGFIATADLGLVAAEAEVRPKATATLLVHIGLWEAVAGGWRIHDFHDYNPTAEAERDKRRKRAEAGRKGGLRSRPPASKPEANAEANASANGQAEPKRIGTPSPYPTEEPTSSDTSPGRLSTPDDDHDPPADDQVERAESALSTLAARDLADRQAAAHLAPVGDVVTWENRAYEQRKARHRADLLRLAGQHPEATPDQLADLVSPPATDQTASGEKVDHRYDEQQKATIARAEAGMAQVAALRDVPADPLVNKRGFGDARAALQSLPHPEAS